MNNNTSNNEMKVCSECKWSLPATTDYFNKCNRVKCGLNAKCKQCRLEYRMKTKDKKKEYDKQHRIENKGKLDSYYATWKTNNREKYLEGKRIYNKENRDKQKSWHEDWVKNNPKRNAELKRNSAQRRLARKRQLPYNYTVEEWENVLKHFNHKCAYCGISTDKMQKEHFIPLSRGGEYTKNNIIPSCWKCNRSKSDKDFFEWYPTYEHYSKQREQKVLEYLNYQSNKTQQLALL